MQIGIDISQLAYENTGVANYLKKVVENLIEKHPEHTYVLFYSSLRRELPAAKFWEKGGTMPKGSHVTIKKFKLPPTFLDFLWNRMHIVPIEYFTGDIDVFISSDWTQPPTKKARKVTILYDLIVYTYPKETAQKIIAVQKRKLNWVQKEVDKVICISQATKQDAMRILGITDEKLSVVYPGL